MVIIVRTCTEGAIKFLYWSVYFQFASETVSLSSNMHLCAKLQPYRSKNAKHEILTLWYIGNPSGFVREWFGIPSSRVFWHDDTFVFASLWHNATFYGNLLSLRLLPIVIVYRGQFFGTRRKKILYAYKIFFLRAADFSASYIRFVIMILADEHPLTFCHLRCQKKITKSWLILNTECRGLREKVFFPFFNDKSR